MGKHKYAHSRLKLIHIINASARLHVQRGEHEEEDSKVSFFPFTIQNFQLDSVGKAHCSLCGLRAPYIRNALWSQPHLHSSPSPYT